MMKRLHVLQGAEAIVSPELSRLTIPNTNESASSKGSVEQYHPQNDYKPPPPQLGNPLNFYLPPLSCSTSPKLHPLYHPARATCDSWLISTLKPQNEAYKQFLIQSMHPLFVCLTTPFGIPARILPICKLISWLFVIDNFSDELLLMSNDLMSEKEYYDLILSLLEGTPVSSTKEWNHELKEMSGVLMEVWADIQAAMPERQQKRFINIIRDVFDATLTQSQRREEQGIVDLDTYLSFRKYTGEGYMFMILAEFGTGLDLDDDVLAHPDIAKLQEMVAYHVAYVNDLLSFRKEFCLGHHQNLPSVLCVHEGYNIQESIFRVCRMIQGLDDEFVSLKKKVMMNGGVVEREG
nr:microbial terpene synthase-like protein 5 [Dryopteris fragrans]